MQTIIYSKNKHFKDCVKIWQDIGWLKSNQEKLAEISFSADDALVCEQNDTALAFGLANYGSYYHNNHKAKLPFCAISAITVALHGRKHGFAGILTAELLARAAEKGKTFAGLGMFEQGFYDRFGFSNYPYTNTVKFRPSDLLVKGNFNSVPVRLTPEEYTRIHANRIHRYHPHGSIDLPERSSQEQLAINKQTFIMGFQNLKGELTHHYAVRSIPGEHGPMRIIWAAFKNDSQFKDILLSLKTFSDQVDIIFMPEPVGIQFQSLLKKPIAESRRSNQNNSIRTGVNTIAWLQGRILNLHSCINTMKCNSKINFNLKLTDPIEKYLDSSFTWRGCAGEYTINLSEQSSVQDGFTNNLPLMECSINTFSKLWSGSSKASKLPYTDSINAPEQLLADLDEVINLPLPSYDWEL